MARLSEIAATCGAEIEGDPGLEILGVAPLDRAGPGELSFLANPKYAAELASTKASAVILAPGVANEGRAVLRVKDPYLAFAKAVSLLYPPSAPSFRGLHPSAVVAEGARVAPTAVLMPFVVVDRGASIGDRSILFPFVYVGENARVGVDCRVYANVSIRESVTLGDRAIVHSGAVLGSDGFGFAPEGAKHRKIPQIGTVEIGDDVEIGAGTTIDRGALGPTRIGRGTKIDNLVQIGHNVQIGEDCILVAQLGISGSTTVGNHVTLAGQVGVGGHLHIGDNAIVAAQSGVARDVAPGEVLWGTPAQPLTLQKRMDLSLTKLPELLTRMRRLEQRIVELERRGGASA